jgi:hypothetical protein
VFRAGFVAMAVHGQNLNAFVNTDLIMSRNTEKWVFIKFSWIRNVTDRSNKMRGSNAYLRVQS